VGVQQAGKILGQSTAHGRYSQGPSFLISLPFVLMGNVKPALFLTMLKDAGFPMKQSKLLYQLLALEK